MHRFKWIEAKWVSWGSCYWMIHSDTQRETSLRECAIRYQNSHFTEIDEPTGSVLKFIKLIRNRWQRHWRHTRHKTCLATRTRQKIQTFWNKWKAHTNRNQIRMQLIITQRCYRAWIYLNYEGNDTKQRYCFCFCCEVAKRTYIQQQRKLNVHNET